jgi:catechol 2,3-dioxygenase-like lactoylglutathione lyase family enzyme
MTTRLNVVAIWAEDVPTATHFYRDVIGLRLLPHHGSYPHFDLDGTYLAILKGTPHPPENPEPERFPIMAFAVDDLDSAIQRLDSHQIEIPWGIEGSEETRWVMFYDPAGNLIELVQFL